MYICRNLYDNWAFSIDLPDTDFFHQAIKEAKSAWEKTKTNPTTISKQQAPIFFCSTLAAATKEEEVVPRAEVYNKKRTKRRFLVIDADYNQGQEDEAARLLEAARALAQKHNTYYLIYPTDSYPTKPRYRLIFFTSQLLNNRRYAQAISWLTEELGVELTDTSDKRINSNYNLPIINSQAQYEAIETNLNQDKLNPLDWKLWKDTHPMPKEVEEAIYDHQSKTHTGYDPYLLELAATVTAELGLVTDYLPFFSLTESIALEVIDGKLDEEQARRLMVLLAENSTAPAAQRTLWAEENTQALSQAIRSIGQRPGLRVRIKPLSERDGFDVAVLD